MTSPLSPPLWQERPEAIHDRNESSGGTPLMMAMFEDHAEVASLLIDYGSDLNAVNNEGSTPLICAVDDGSPDCVKLLLARGADFTIRNKRGHTALDIASRDPKKAGIAADIRCAMAGGFPLEPAQPVTGERKLALDFVVAAERGDMEKFRRILKEHPEAAKMREPASGNTGLVMIVSNRNATLDDVRQLLENGADINACDALGWTPLMCSATKKGMKESFDLLKRAGADPTLRNRWGNTAAEVADINQDPEAGKYVIYEQDFIDRVVEKTLIASLTEGAPDAIAVSKPLSFRMSPKA
jgi:ankyrin repeat protein